MGTLYLVANITRKEYINPHTCDSGGKIGEMAGTASFQRVFTHVMLYDWLFADDVNQIVMVPDYSENYGLVHRKYKDITLDAINELNRSPIENLFHIGNIKSLRKYKFWVSQIVLPPDYMLKERNNVIIHMDEFLAEYARVWEHREMMDELEACSSWNTVQEIKSDLHRERFKEFTGLYPEEFFRNPTSQTTQESEPREG